MSKPYHIDVPLTDEEYIELLTLFISANGDLSMNRMMYLDPELTAKIMKHISDSKYDYVIPYPHAFIIDAWEIKESARSILDPKQDVLGLFANDNDLRTFVQAHEFGKICYY